MGWSGTSLSADHIFVQALSEPKLSVLDILVECGVSCERRLAPDRLRGVSFLVLEIPALKKVGIVHPQVSQESGRMSGHVLLSCLSKNKA